MYVISGKGKGRGVTDLHKSLSGCSVGGVLNGYTRRIAAAPYEWVVEGRGEKDVRSVTGLRREKRERRIVKARYIMIGC